MPDKTEDPRWQAMALAVLEKVKINDEPALDFIDRAVLFLPIDHQDGDRDA